VTLENGPTARVWDAVGSDGPPLSTLTQRQEITSAAFGPNGTLIVTGSRDGTGRVWESRTGTLKASLEGHTSQILTVAFSPAGDRVATGSTDDTARLWTTSGGLVDVVHDLTASIVSVAFAPDGSSVAVASSDGNAVTFGPAHVKQLLYGQAGTMKMAAFAPDGTTVATVGGSTVRLWEPYGEPRLQGIHKFAEPATAVSFDVTGRFLASGDSGGSVLIQRAHGQPVKMLAIGSPVVAVSWTNTSGLLLAAGRDGVLHVYTDDLRAYRKFENGSPIVDAAIGIDGRYVAAAGADGVIRVWDTSSARLLLTLPAIKGVSTVAISQNGFRVAAGVGDTVRLYDTHGPRLVREFLGHTDAVTGVEFSPGGDQLASSSKDHDVRLWSIKTGKLVKVLHRHVSFVGGLAFSWDGRWIATAGPLKAGIWAVPETDLPGSFLQFVRGNQLPIASVAFSPRGNEVATAARDGSIRFYHCKLCGGLPQLQSYAKARLADLRR
jgi:WD40 repeat protein